MIGVGGFKITSIAKRYVNEALEAGRLSQGPFVKEFEEQFGQLHGLKYSTFCNSGTSALQVSIHALKIKYGWDKGEIIVPATTFVASVNTIIQNGLTPVLVDVKEDDFMIDPRKIEAKITPDTKAIMVVHIAGQVANMTPILAIAEKYGLRIIEDSCEAMFVEGIGKGDVTCFSTYAAHLLVTGVGGLACTNDKELAVLIKSLCNHGRNNVYLTIDDTPRDINKRFEFEYVGYSYRATELEGALGLAQLTDYMDMIIKRQNNADYLTKGLKDLPLRLPVKTGDHAYMMYCILYPNRDKLTQYLEKRGIETRLLLPLTNQPVYKGIFNEDDYPMAKRINKEGFYIGCHPEMNKKDLDYVIKVFKEYEGFYSRN